MTGKNICLCFRTNSTILKAFFISTNEGNMNSTQDANPLSNISMSTILYDNIIHPEIKNLEKKLLKKEGK